MKKIFAIATRPGGMIAWNPNGKAVLLITKSYFDSLVRELLSDQRDEAELTMFSMRITHHMKSGKEDENDKLQDLLNKRLKAKLDNGDLPIIKYSFEGDEAKKHIDDFLEAYKFNEKHINYAVGMLHDGTDEILNISLRRKQSLVQKMRGLLGDPYDEINIMRSEIIELNGNAFNFKVTLKSNKNYLFGENGVTC